MRMTTILLTGLLATPATAYTDIASARRAFQAAPLNDFFAERQQRIAMAEAVRNYWTDFDSRLPRLSPSELEWLTGEMDTTDMVRINRVTQTREFHLYQLGNIADQCTDAADGLVMAINTPAQHDSEMFHWTKIASCYHRSNTNIFRHLMAAGLDSKGDPEDGHTLDDLLLSQILNTIIPSSMADTMGWTLNWD